MARVGLGAAFLRNGRQSVALLGEVSELPHTAVEQADQGSEYRHVDAEAISEAEMMRLDAQEIQAEAIEERFEAARGEKAHVPVLENPVASPLRPDETRGPTLVVGRAEYQKPARPQDAHRLRQERDGILQMLDQLVGVDDVEASILERTLVQELRMDTHALARELRGPLHRGIAAYGVPTPLARAEEEPPSAAAYIEELPSLLEWSRAIQDSRVAPSSTLADLARDLEVLIEALLVDRGVQCLGIQIRDEGAQVVALGTAKVLCLLRRETRPHRGIAKHAVMTLHDNSAAAVCSRVVDRSFEFHTLAMLHGPFILLNLAARGAAC